MSVVGVLWQSLYNWQFVAESLWRPHILLTLRSVPPLRQPQRWAQLWLPSFGSSMLASSAGKAASMASSFDFSRDHSFRMVEHLTSRLSRCTPPVGASPNCPLFPSLALLIHPSCLWGFSQRLLQWLGQGRGLISTTRWALFSKCISISFCFFTKCLLGILGSLPYRCSRELLGCTKQLALGAVKQGRTDFPVARRFLWTIGCKLSRSLGFRQTGFLKLILSVPLYQKYKKSISSKQYMEEIAVDAHEAV